MKIKVVSDLHLEFSDVNIQNNENCDVLILSGDIMTAEDLHDHPESSYGMYSNVNLDNLGRRQAVALRFRDFLKRVSFQFPHVVYVAGNHEFYHGRWDASIDHLREECAKFTNVYFLERDMKVIDDVIFVGGTLWTDMNKEDSLTMFTIRSIMNDFRVIKKDNDNWTNLKPADTTIRHRQTLDYIRLIVDDNKDKKCVVVGHHSPSFLSAHAMYKDDTLMNGAYHSSLEEFIMDRPQIKLWTHGHTHYAFDYVIGETRVVCNPRGYEGHEPYGGWDKTKFIEI
jgi:predicted phosphodiesterase